MEKYAVICAMSSEAESLIKALSLKKVDSRSGALKNLYEGEYNNKYIIVTVCGIGKVYAAMTCQSMIDSYSPDVIINLGIAGGIAPGIRTGDICISSDFVQYDYDMSAIGDPKGLIDGFSEIKIPADKMLTEKLNEAANIVTADAKIYCGTIGTGDRFVSSSGLAREINSSFGAVCCEMEGASMAQVCALNGVSFCAVRSISDNANESAPFDVESFEKKAVENSTSILLAFLEK